MLLLSQLFGIGVKTTVCNTNSIMLPSRRFYMKSNAILQFVKRDYNHGMCTRSHALSSSSKLKNILFTDVLPSKMVPITTPATANSIRCVPCSTLDGSHIVDVDTLRARLPTELPLWSLDPFNNNTTDNNKKYYILSRSFIAKNFQCALDSINAMGVIAEEQNHHPDFHLTNYRDVKVVLFTHNVNGITENDILLAKLLDSNVRIEYSPKWLSDHPEATTTSKTHHV
jgi:4a-hydroxytetrahydrobiopterin dehydratase